jgi:hypothetical protein
MALPSLTTWIDAHQRFADPNLPTREMKIRTPKEHAQRNLNVPKIYLLAYLAGNHPPPPQEKF